MNIMVDNSNKATYDEVFESLEKHNKWFENSVPLIASENIPSPAVREAIISDFGNRYAEATGKITRVHGTSLAWS